MYIHTHTHFNLYHLEELLHLHREFGSTYLFLKQQAGRLETIIYEQIFNG